MDLLAPGGPVYQAGTLSGNPLAMSAGIAVLDEVSKKGFYEELNAASGELFTELTSIAKRKKLPSTPLERCSLSFFRKSRSLTMPASIMRQKPLCQVLSFNA